MFGIAKSKIVRPEALPDFPALDIPGFEDELGEAFDAVSAEEESFLEEPETSQASDAVEDDAGQAAAPELRQSTSTRTNLAALAAFESEMRNAAASLDAMDATIAAIGAAHETANRFLGSLRAGVLRANDIEEANAMLLADNRRLSERLEQTKHMLSQHESADEVNKRKIELLTRDYDETKMALGKCQIELIEMRDALADTDGEKTTLIYELANKSTLGDRLFRENELLRQKFLSQQMANAELEQRYADIERKLEEQSAIRKAETAEMSDLRMRFESTEKEYKRLQKQSELSRIRLAETQERVMTLEADLEEVTDRNKATTERFRSEAEILKAKLESAARKNIADTDEIAALKLQIGDAVSAASMAEIQLACANGQIEAHRTSRPEPAMAAHAVVATDPGVIGPVSYERSRPGKKPKKIQVDAKRAGKSESRIAHSREEHG